MYPVGLRGWTEEMAGLLPSGHALGHQKNPSNYLSLGIPLTLKQNTHLLNSLCSAMTPKRRKKMSLYMKYLYTRGGTSHILRPQFLLAISSLNMRMPPGREKKKKKKSGVEEGEQMNQPHSIAWANLWNPASWFCSQCNYTQPVECCPGNAVSKSLEN